MTITSLPHLPSIVLWGYWALLGFLDIMESMKNIGIYSGSFDPVHAGHIAFAREAMRVCNLETVIFMPERFPRGKPNVSPISERITELELALAQTPFQVLNAHTDQFTVDETLTELEALYPDTTFTFLVGSDVALHLAKWKNIERLTKRYEFAVGMRAEDTFDAVAKELDSLSVRYVILETNQSHLSSRSVRTTKR